MADCENIHNDSENECEDFEASVLGTKEFWEDNFQRDFHVYQENFDIGDIWFGKESVDRILKWMNNKNIRKNASIIDIGCGNGATLIALAEEGYTNLSGFDYATSAIELATCVASDSHKNIAFQVCDFLNPSERQESDCKGATGNSLLDQQYDICLDKGTYDAICLNPVKRAKQRLLYKSSVANICKVEDGLFVITSCNWTKKELIDQFSPEFVLDDLIPTPVFHFGGSVGSRETVCVFKKATIILDDNQENKSDDMEPVDVAVKK